MLTVLYGTIYRKKVLLWHHEAPLFLRVKVFPLYTMYVHTVSNLHINVFLGQHVMKKRSVIMGVIIVKIS